MIELRLRPPRLARWLFDRSLHEVHRDEVLGDLEEGFAEQAVRLGAKRAHLWYWGQFVRSLPLFLLATVYWSVVMLKNYLKTAFRTMKRQPGYTVINVAGLSVGIALSLLALLYVEHELSFDRHYEKADRMYRVVQEAHTPGYNTTGFNSVVGISVARKLPEFFPQIESVGRITDREITIKYNNRPLRISQQFIDPSMLDLFDIEIIRGGVGEAFEAGATYIISERAARRIFGDEDPIGKVFDLGFLDPYVFPITAVARDMPVTAHFWFDLLRVYPSSLAEDAIYEDTYTYVLLREGATPESVEERFPEYAALHDGAIMDMAAERCRAEGRGACQSWDEFISAGGRVTYHLQPVSDIHLDHVYSYFWDKANLRPKGDRTTIYMLAVIALFILVLSCVGFVNLATARATKRLTEVGVRKVVGSSRRQLIGQFLIEATLLSLLAVLVAATLVALALPAFNDFMRVEITLGLSSTPFVLSTLLVVALLVGVLSGSYPAFVLSSFRPVWLLKGSRRAGTKGLSLRNGLVVFQFFISILLIGATLVVFEQVSFLRSRDMGFSGEQVLVLKDVSRKVLDAMVPVYRAELDALGADLDVEGWASMSDTEKHRVVERAGRFWPWQSRRVGSFTERLARLPGVVSATNSWGVPGDFGVYGGFGGFQPAGAPGAKISARGAQIDFRYFETLGIELVAGRTLSDVETGPGGLQGIVINESLAALLGPESPIGSTLAQRGRFIERGWWQDIVDLPIVGVVKDFHYEDIHAAIQPTVFQSISRERGAPPSDVLVRLRPEDIAGTIASIEALWREYVPDEPLDYVFLDDDFQKMWENETRLGTLFGFFATLAVVIACLGLFGLAAYMAERRTKEIGIRKALGASMRDILQLLTKRFLWLLLVGNVVAWPIGYLAAERWLEHFAYRVDLGLGVFLLTGLLALVLVLLSVGGQALRASLANPVDSLRYE